MGLLSLRFWVYTLGHWELTTWLLSWNPLSSSYQRWEANTGFHFITWVAGTYSHFLVFIIFIYWLCQVSGAAHGIFSCGIQTLGCGMWDLVPWPGIEPGPPALGARSLSHWTTREVLVLSKILNCLWDLNLNQSWGNWVVLFYMEAIVKIKITEQRK